MKRKRKVPVGYVHCEGGPLHDMNVPEKHTKGTDITYPFGRYVLEGWAESRVYVWQEAA